MIAPKTKVCIYNSYSHIIVLLQFVTSYDKYELLLLLWVSCALAAKDEEPHVFQETHSDKTSTIGLDEIGWTCRASKQANPRSVMMTMEQAIDRDNDVKSSKKATMNQTIGSAKSVESYKLNQYTNHSFHRSTRRHRRRNTSSSQHHSLREVMRGCQ